tara:strand:+ start:845 stop:1129 length:285 start_codon:yes stop_codon:yes gene_type:complete
MLDPVTGGTASAISIVGPLIAGVLGVVAFAAALAGFLVNRLSFQMRGLSFIAAGLLLAPGPEVMIFGISLPVLDAAGLILFALLVAINRTDRVD